MCRPVLCDTRPYGGGDLGLSVCRPPSARDKEDRARRPDGRKTPGGYTRHLNAPGNSKNHRVPLCASETGRGISPSGGGGGGGRYIEVRAPCLLALSDPQRMISAAQQAVIAAGRTGRARRLITRPKSEHRAECLSGAANTATGGVTALGDPVKPASSHRWSDRTQTESSDQIRAPEEPA